MTSQAQRIFEAIRRCNARACVGGLVGVGHSKVESRRVRDAADVVPLLAASSGGGDIMQTPLASDVRPHPTHRDRTGGLIEGLLALVGIVLASLGLAGGPRFFDAIATMAIGAAFPFETWTVAAGAHDRDIWAARVAGWAGVLLGLVVLRWLSPTVFIPIALLAFGVGLVFSTGLASGPVGVAIGSVAIALGVLSIVPLHPRLLTLIGIIAVGAVLVLTGPTTAWRLRGDATPAV